MSQSLLLIEVLHSKNEISFTYIGFIDYIWGQTTLYLGLNYRTMYQATKLCDKWGLQAYYGYVIFFLLTSPFLPRPVFRY